MTCSSLFNTCNHADWRSTSNSFQFCPPVSGRASTHPLKTRLQVYKPQSGHLLAKDTTDSERFEGHFMMAHSAISVQPGLVVSTNNARLNQWNSGVCDCCEDMGICCCGFWCPYCLMCRTSEEFGECLCLPLLEMCFGGILPPVTLAVRSSMRERFHIKGSIQDDCCVVTFCTVCVWCQMARELKARRHSLVVINPAVNPVHQHPQAFNQPLQPINPAYQ